MVDGSKTHNSENDGESDDYNRINDRQGNQKNMNLDSPADQDLMDRTIGDMNDKSYDGDCEEMIDGPQFDSSPPPESVHRPPSLGRVLSASTLMKPVGAIDVKMKQKTLDFESKSKTIDKVPGTIQSLKKKGVYTASSLDALPPPIPSRSNPNSSLQKKCSIAKPSVTTTYRIVPRRNRRRTRRNYDSDEDDSDDDASESSIAKEKSVSFGRDIAASSDIPTDRRRLRTNRRRNRRNFGSSDEEDDLDDDDDDDDDDDFLDGDSNHTSRSQSTRATTNSELYNSVGAVAVYSTGVLVTQRPAIITQPSEQDLQQHEEQESQNNLMIDAEVCTREDEEPRKGQDTSVPLGDEDSSPFLQNDDETLISAAVDILTVPVTTAGASGRSGLGKKKSNEIIVSNAEKQEKLGNLPWYWSPVFWSVVGAMVVALGVIVAVILVLGGNESNPIPSSSPTMAPTTLLPTIQLDPIKVKAFEKHVILDGGISSNVTWQKQSTPQLEAYHWLMTIDQATKFSDTMSKDEIERMKTRYILAVFYYALRGSKWISSNGWLDSTLDHCRWQYVDCRQESQGNNISTEAFRHVGGLRIENNNLNGSIPNELVYLPNLYYLWLPGNAIKSAKALVGGFAPLAFVSLSGNPLRNHKDLFRLTDLRSLMLDNTDFSGTLPLEVQQLSNLRLLNLSYNKLLGQLTNRFQTMFHLEHLFLNGNQFNSTLDEILNCGNCTRTLNIFESLRNPLTGNIPQRLFDFSLLSKFAVTQSKLTGTIPSGFGRLSALTHLDLQANYYFSENNVLPSEIGNLMNLEELWVSESEVNGTVPQEFSNLSSLKSLRIARTRQMGSIAKEICDIDGLEIILHSSGVNCPCEVCELIEVE